jgi:uncharacterized membrane protein
MIRPPGDISAPFFRGLLTFLPILGILGLLLLAPPDGTERALLLQFLGRFHPLAVHVPIALLVLAPFLELAARKPRFAYLLPATSFLLGVATFSAVFAALLGWSLARSGGYSGPLMTQHMWGGLFVMVAAWSCWMLRVNSASNLKRLYPATLVTAVALVSFTGYRGGQLSQGENHLTEFMPAPLASVLGVADPADAPTTSSNGGPATFYGARIQPVFAGHCITCHGRNKHKSNLRLDSYDAVMRGGKHGPVIKPGDLKTSELFHRITLSPSDDDFMPPENRRPLSLDDVKLIEQWIATGASGTLLAGAMKDAPLNATAPVAEVSFEEINPDVVAKRRAGLAPVLTQLQGRFPNIVNYESRGSTDLIVTASWMETRFGDDELAALAPLVDHIVTGDFSNTSITDKSAPIFARMKRLRSLRLIHTKISDVTLQALGSLDQLESVSIFDTSVTSAGLVSLGHLPKLQRIYVGGTKISAEMPLAPEIRNKLVF